ncbi:MAG: 2-succinyl-5-enolpyruvyl-6-hydroxy-3-cyclohexene-1-carboxylic-acid synthase [Nitrososphaerota archaeon]|nr:2-succinyl-5-enolpyruvyl-6-hydroxy-3-cyclohexene-1-carboxylic-acid synthase [Nitrososphaerota archaeon]MDG6978951.1 2-succinyl-5-enolpyruvyl-6-hydroxy-3-cyclohexene-1-carboxylic-acid synthase [Nitrososphaerota archaeon]MDG7021840.1 2-succinyl-5-enolpyruvyl-6-hydroxy-3-cyclohexene-1-carboxylic-acid synthase [Nitrososphaerota archaeon]
MICPGSRSTPIALALARRAGDVRQWVLFDERSAAFFALGVAKSSGSPVAVVSTSGTAAANLLPAVAEARLGRVPLVAVTADRPPESRDFGGAQTIDQVGLFGSHAKWFQDLPLAADPGLLARYSRIVGARASHTALSQPRGPVHVNFSFREPLLPDSPSPGAYSRGGTRAVVVVGARAFADEASLNGVAAELGSHAKGLIVAGPGEYPVGLRGALSALSERLGWPLLADALSNLRQDGAVNGGVVRCYEPLVRSEAFQARKPDCVLRIGGVPTSKELNLFCQGATTVILDDAEGWRDPDFAASAFVFGDLEHSVRSLQRAVGAGPGPDPGWRRVWESASADAEARMDSMMGAVAELFEGKLFHLLSKMLRPAAPLTVVVGSSMPVRDLDYFFLRGSKNVRLVANRGANGIDGVVSTAMGVAAAEGDVLLVLGDVSFYHDTNGLLASRLHHLNATVIVVNNRGGGIFSFLPQHSLPKEVFERLFGEAHDIDFSGVSTLYGGKFHRVSDWAGLERALGSSAGAKGLRVIELMAEDRERNVELHRAAFKALAAPPGSEEAPA